MLFFFGGGSPKNKTDMLWGSFIFWGVGEFLEGLYEQPLVVLGDRTLEHGVFISTPLCQESLRKGQRKPGAQAVGGSSFFALSTYPLLVRLSVPYFLVRFFKHHLVSPLPCTKVATH